MPLTPFRVLDTRIGIGAPIGMPAAGSTVTVQVGGVGTVPANASAVALNVTATQAADGGFVTVFPGGSPQPLSSNLNIDHIGQTIPNLVVVTLPSNGTVSLYTYGRTHLLADVLGYFVNANTSTDGRYVALSPGPHPRHPQRDRRAGGQGAGRRHDQRRGRRPGWRARRPVPARWCST